MREFGTLYTDFMARQGQKPHNSHWLRDRRDESCSGAIGRAYRREQVEGRQRWIVIGEYCDGCETFWPLKAIERRRRYTPPPRPQPITTAAGDEDTEVPHIVRFLRGDPN